MSGQSFKKFVSEEEVTEERQRRQAEWERIRKEDDPEECPEEETRSLFDQLQANKNLKEREFEDETKLRSSVKGLDDEEAQFLNYVSNRQMQLEKERSNEEKSLIKEMEAAKVIKVTEKAKEQKADPEKTKPSPPTASASASSTGSGKKSQMQLLSGAIKRKSVDTDHDHQAKMKKSPEQSLETNRDGKDEGRADSKMMAGLSKGNGVAFIAGVLPGISRYDDDDSSTENSSNSSDSEADHMVLPSAVTQRVLQDMIKKIKGDCG